MGIRPELDGNRILAAQAVAAILTELPCLLLNAYNYCTTGYGVGAFEALVRGVEFCSGTERTVVYGDPPCSESCEVPERFFPKIICYSHDTGGYKLHNTKLLRFVRTKHSFTYQKFIRLSHVRPKTKCTYIISAQ